MRRMAWVVKWVLYAAIFFTFFAFALNNQQDATLRFFFGTQWQMPMVLVVLSAFSAGLIVGILAMVPRWWRHRRIAKSIVPQTAAPLNAGPAGAPTTPEHEH